MKNSRNKIIYFCTLLIAGVLFTDIVSAAKNNKRASKSKTKTPRKKITTTVSVDTESEERAASSVRARGDTTTSTTTTAVDEDTAAEVLASQLMSCVYSQCSGDVAYEKCFKNANDPETFIRTDTTCLNMYNAADTDMIRIKARNIMTSKIKGYFSEACESAGGKIKGNECEVDICYYAKAGGKSDKKHNKCMGFKIGKSVTCSYTQFGLSDQDMEYKEEMTGEQLGAIIQSGMGMVSGLMTTGLAIADSVSASRELKKLSDIKGKNCYGVYSYETQSITLEPSTDCVEVWKKCPDGKKTKDSECKNATKTDSAGNYYTVDDRSKEPNKITIESIKKTLSDNNKVYGPAPQPPAVQTVTEIKECGLVKKGDNNLKCLVKFEEYSEAEKKTKEAEFYKKFTDFNNLQFKDNVNAYYLQTQIASQLPITQSNSTSDKCSFDIDPTNMLPSVNTCKTQALNKCRAQDMEPDINTCILDSWDKNISGTGNTATVVYQAICSCSAKKRSVANNGNNTSNLDTFVANVNNGTFQIGNSNIEGFATNNYSSAVETYNSMQKSVNESKAKVTSLEQRKSEGLSTAISTGASTLLTQGGSLATSIVAANSNTGTMTGACYIGDPEKGGHQFLSEGAVKKLTWNSL